MVKQDLKLSKVLVAAAVLFGLLVLQQGVLVELRITPVNLILVFLILSVVLFDFNFTIALAIAGGLMLDFASPLPDGLITFSVLAVILSLDFVINRIMAREPSYYIFFGSVLAGSVVYIVAFMLVGLLFNALHIPTPFVYSDVFIRRGWVELLFNLIFTYPVLQLAMLFKRLNQ